MKIIQAIATKNRCYLAGRKITVKGLMLHSVGCPQPDAKVFVNSWNSPNAAVCVHGVIDGNNGDVYQTLPWNHRGWHGGGSSNNTHIGVEMCEPACIRYSGGDKFTCSDLPTARAVAQRTYDNAVALFAHLCAVYKLNPLGDGVIVSHNEGHKRGIASGHTDPEHLWKGLGMGYTMDTFRKAVKAAMTVTTTEDPVEPVYNQKQFIKDVQMATGAAVDGIAGKETINKTVTLSAKKNSRHGAVKPVQKYLHALGYTEVGKADGIAGAKFTSAVAHFQQDNGCVVDGEITAKKLTWKKLLGMA